MQLQDLRDGWLEVCEAVGLNDPLPLTVAAQRIGVAPEQCVYVGDDERDILAARAAGMPSVVALWGYRLSEDDPFAWQGDVMVDAPSVLVAAEAWPATS